jgi:hypothetical protein
MGSTMRVTTCPACQTVDLRSSANERLEGDWGKLLRTNAYEEHRGQVAYFVSLEILLPTDILLSLGDKGSTGGDQEMPGGILGTTQR